MAGTSAGSLTPSIALAARPSLDPAALIEKALTAHPNEPQFYNRLGLEYSRHGQYGEAGDCFAHAVQLEPRDARLWYNLGTATHASGDVNRALRYYRVALRLNPSYDRAHRAVAMIESLSPAASPARSAAVSTAEPVGAIPATSELLAPSAARPPLVNIETAALPGLLTRAAAALVDLLIVQVFVIAAVVAVNALQQYGGVTIPNGLCLLGGVAAAILMLLITTARAGQTPGKAWLRVRVVDAAGAAPGAARATLRTVGAALTAATAGVGYLLGRSDPRERTLSDRVSGTFVVGRRMDAGAAAIWLAGAAVVNYLVFSLMIAPQFQI